MLCSLGYPDCRSQAVSAMDVGPFQLVDGDGEFNYSGVIRFMNATRMDKCGLNYSVISILGPKISGKSTLLNHLFGVNFKNDLGGSSPTDKGIWLAKSTIMATFTVVMDLQSIIGKDATRFEKQSIIFALAVSDIVMINMWSHDIETKNATNMLLLSTIFQAMLHLSSQRKTKLTLLFVVRDDADTPLNFFENMLKADIQKIWDSIVKPTNEISPPTKFFDIEVVSLQSYEQEKESFERQVAALRIFCYSIVFGQFVENRQGVDPASIFSSSTREIWKLITDDKPLKFDDFKSIIYAERCKRIADEKYSSFCNDEEWLNIKRLDPSETIQNFGNEVSKILQKHFTDYDVQVCFFDNSIRASEREILKSRFASEILNTYESILHYILTETLIEFKNNFDIEKRKTEEYPNLIISSTKYAITEFDKKCEDVVIEEIKFNPSIVRDQLFRRMRDHVALVCKEKAKSYELGNFYAKVMATIFGNKTAETSSSDQIIR